MTPRLELVIEPGTDKRGGAEPVDTVRVGAGEVVALVGPTGSGKTRLLADLERLADGDSPTRRRVQLLDESGASLAPDGAVARISQSMGFFLDATVEELLAMHCAYRGRAAESATIIDGAVDWANRICGEGFGRGSLLAELSGGQARALMVADTVLVSRCPVLLIDEIENAGIERTLALELLLENQIIAVLATHDPVIALGAGRRLVMANGAITQVVVRSPAEQRLLEQLSEQQAEREALQRRLRSGRPLTDG